MAQLEANNVYELDLGRKDGPHLRKGIADAGAIALAEALETNTSLKSRG